MKLAEKSLAAQLITTNKKQKATAVTGILLARISFDVPFLMYSKKLKQGRLERHISTGRIVKGKQNVYFRLTCVAKKAFALYTP